MRDERVMWVGIAMWVRTVMWVGIAMNAVVTDISGCRLGVTPTIYVPTSGLDIYRRYDSFYLKNSQ